MKKYKSRLFCLILVCSILISMLVVYPSFDINAQQKEDIKISSLEDFKNKLARQIYDRDAYRSYIVEDKSLRKSIVHIKFDQINHHYNPDDPLLSCSYLVYYLDKLYTESRGKRVKVRLVFSYNKRAMDSHFENLDKLSTRLKGKSDYDTILNVHDYLIDNFEYDFNTSMQNHTDIDGFRDKVMVCSGYSLAAYYLLNKAGIETRIITGYGGEGSGPNNHMWNAIKVDDQWYNMDITWDDEGQGGKSYTYFLKSDSNFQEHTRTGDYDVNGIPLSIADKSYKHPFTLNNPEELPKLLYGLLILLLILYIYIKKLKNKNTTNYTVQGYVVHNDFDDYYDNDDMNAIDEDKVE